MVEDPEIVLIGAGFRGRSHLRCLYRIRTETHHGRKPDDSSLTKPQAIYETHAAEQPAWAESVADLQPSVTAVVDPDPAARETAIEICQDHGDDPALFSSFEELPTDNVFDAAVIASPNHTHVEYVVPLLDRGINVLCEKPLATTLPEHDVSSKLIERPTRCSMSGSTCATHRCISDCMI